MVVTRVDCMDKVAGLVANVGGKVVTAKLVVASHSSWMFAAPDETVLKQYSFPLFSPDLRQEKRFVEVHKMMIYLIYLL